MQTCVAGIAGAGRLSLHTCWLQELKMRMMTVSCSLHRITSMCRASGAAGPFPLCLWQLTTSRLLAHIYFS